MKRWSLERLFADVSLDFVGDSTSILDVSSPLVARHSFLFWEFSYFETLECFRVSLASALERYSFSSHIPD